MKEIEWARLVFPACNRGGVLQARADAIVQCCDALCALLNGSPDNHLAVSQSGSSARAVEVLATLSSIPLDKHSVAVRLSLIHI